MKSYHIVGIIAIIACLLVIAACGCGNQDQAAANQPPQPATGRPPTNNELTKQRQATIQRHKDE